MEYVELFRDLLGSVSEQVRRGLREGRTLEELKVGVDLARFWRQFTGDDDRRFAAFTERFQPVLVERAHLEAVSGR